MRVGMVKQKGNADIQFLLLPEFSGEHSCSETAHDKLRYLRFLQVLCCSEESDNIFLDVYIQILELNFRQSCLAFIDLEEVLNRKSCQTITKLVSPTMGRWRNGQIK